MARAYKCDRCRRLYERNTFPDLGVHYYVTSVSRIDGELVHDLCPECTKLLVDFMCNYSKEKDDA